MPQDWKLGETSHDIEFSNGDIQLISGAQYYRQKTSIELQVFLGEWTFDITYGIDFFKIFLIKNPDLTLCDNLIRLTVSEITGIQEITEFKSSFNKFQRIYTYSFKCVTIDGDIIIFNDEVTTN